MKVKSSVRRICNYCFVVTRKKKKYIYCLKNLKHKQRQK